MRIVSICGVSIMEKQIFFRSGITRKTAISSRNSSCQRAELKSGGDAVFAETSGIQRLGTGLMDTVVPNTDDTLLKLSTE